MMGRGVRGCAVGALAIVLAGCTLSAGAGQDDSAPEIAGRADLPAMRWAHRPEADRWTQTTLTALASHGASLPALTPRDIETWCPAYPEASPAERKLFWTALLSALAKHESTWNPRAVGGGGRWFGLVQIAPATARGYGCAAKSGAALKDGAANLNCAIRIMAHTVSRDQVVSEGFRGVAADWGPFHSARKRQDMIAWTNAQPYCQADAKPRTPLATLKSLASRGKPKATD